VMEPMIGVVAFVLVSLIVKTDDEVVNAPIAVGPVPAIVKVDKLTLPMLPGNDTGIPPIQLVAEEVLVLLIVRLEAKPVVNVVTTNAAVPVMFSVVKPISDKVDTVFEEPGTKADELIVTVPTPLLTPGLVDVSASVIPPVTNPLTVPLEANNPAILGSVDGIPKLMVCA